MLLLCVPKAYVTMPAKNQSQTTGSKSTKINKNPFATRTFRPSLKECFCILYFWNTQQKQEEIRARQFSTRINKLACEVWSSFGHSILAKNLGYVLARGPSYQGLEAFEARPQSTLRPGLKGLEALLLFFKPPFTKSWICPKDDLNN